VPTRPAAATIAVTFTHVRSPDDDGVDDDEVVVAPRVPRDAIRGVSSSIGPFDVALSFLASQATETQFFYADPFFFSRAEVSRSPRRPTMPDAHK
jgi:hypothetical protein